MRTVWLVIENKARPSEKMVRVCGTQSIAEMWIEDALKVDDTRNLMWEEWDVKWSTVPDSEEYR